MAVVNIDFDKILDFPYIYICTEPQGKVSIYIIFSGGCQKSIKRKCNFKPGANSDKYGMSIYITNTLGAETFASRNFREFREFCPNSRKFKTRKILI